MTCVHLHELHEFCQTHEIKLGSSDLIRIVCHKCQEQEVCPAMMTDEYDARTPAVVIESEATSSEADSEELANPS